MFRVLGVGFLVLCTQLGCRILGFVHPIVGFGFRVWDSEFCTPYSGFRVSGAGFYTP